MAKELQNLGLDMGLALLWIEVNRRKAEVENVDIRVCATKLSQEMTQYGSLQKQTESANQELALINMATVRKKHALTVVEDLISRGVTSEQIIQLINFVGEWDRYWHMSANGNPLQQPNGSSNNDSSNPPSSSIPDPVIKGNNGHSDLSMNDWTRLNFLKGSTSNMLNKMAPRYNYSDFH